MTSSNSPMSKRIPQIQGTKVSTRNAQITLSTGCPCLDHMIGGGLPVGSIFLIEEDVYGKYASIMMKYFIAEGIVSLHDNFIASLDATPSQILREIPSVATESTIVQQEVNEEMKIAWRYKNMKLVDASPSENQVPVHYFDLTKPMDKDLIERSQVTEWNSKNMRWKMETFDKQEYVDLLKSIEETLTEGQFSVSSNPLKRNILRISINSLGSRMWMSDEEAKLKSDILSFLYALRAILRNHYAVANITFPVQLYDNKDAFVERLEHLADTVIELKSFDICKEERNPVFKDYHGLMFIKKIATFNSLTSHIPQSVDLAFKLRKKKFILEILHIPPELEDTSQREQDNLSCGINESTKNNILEF